MSEDTPVQEAEQQQAVLLTFTNDKSERNLGVLRGLLKMVYHTTLTNKLAVMEALNTESGETELVLVGVEQNGDSLNCYPLFKPITDVDAAKYASPDGAGGFIGRTPEVSGE